jgi:hypothetical protein
MDNYKFTVPKDITMTYKGSPYNKGWISISPGPGLLYINRPHSRSYWVLSSVVPKTLRFTDRSLTVSIGSTKIQFKKESKYFKFKVMVVRHLNPESVFIPRRLLSKKK